MKCVRCSDSKLVHETYEGVGIDRCKKCGGAWLDDKEIVSIVSERDVTFTTSQAHEVISKQVAGVPAAEKETSLMCPFCSNQLKPINYNYNSGVIIDHCPQGDGIWMDKGELEKIQIAAEHWEDKAKELSGEWQDMISKVEATTSNKLYNNTLNPIKMLINFLTK